MTSPENSRSMPSGVDAKFRAKSSKQEELILVSHSCRHSLALGFQLSQSNILRVYFGFVLFRSVTDS